MRRIVRFAVKIRILWDTHGQDLLEYALIAAFISVMAVAISPDAAANVKVVISKVNSSLIRSERGPRSSEQH